MSDTSLLQLRTTQMTFIKASHFTHTQLFRIHPTLTFRHRVSSIQDVPGGMCQTSGGCSLC